SCRHALISPPTPPTSSIYTLSLHDALPISLGGHGLARRVEHHSHHGFALQCANVLFADPLHPFLREKLPDRLPHLFQRGPLHTRSEEHTSELQSRRDLVCRLLLEKKKRQRQ